MRHPGGPEDGGGPEGGGRPDDGGAPENTPEDRASGNGGVPGSGGVPENTPGDGASDERDPAVFVRPELRRLSAYHLDLSPCRHKLDQNEVPFDLPGSAKRAALAALASAEWSRYPDFHADALRREIGELHGWPAAGVLVGNGSNELLDLALQALVRRGGEVLGTEPSFGLFPMFVAKAGGVLHNLRAGPDLRLPLDALEAEVERDPRRPVLLCSPNNPTGDAATPERIERLLARLEAPLLLDNAYAEFSRHDYRPLLGRHPHLVLLRTFSKAWSLAGMRLGYLLADPRLVGELIKVKLPYNLGHAAACAGRAALAARPAARRRVALLLGRRSQWAAMLAQAGLEVLPSEANFLLVRCAGPAAASELRDGLEARGIRVRDVGSYPGLAGCLRVSVGGGAALRDTRRALAEILAGVPPDRARSAPGAGALESPPAPRAGAAAPLPAPAAGVLESPPAPAAGPLAAAGLPGGAARRGAFERRTAETSVELALSLAGGPRRIAVPNGFFGHMLEALATHAGFGLEARASGDVQVDLHHTVEDVGIAFGAALAEALGERRGITRFGHAYAPLDEALARAVVDLSGRAFFAYAAPRDIAAAWVTPEFPLTLVADFFQAAADRGRLNLHLEVLSARNAHHAAEAAFKAVALALRQAVAPAGGAGVPSTKGTLSR
jgi:histidinol-phosphate aminotransferase